MLALPDGGIDAKYDLLIGTWWTAIWHSKKSNFAVFKHCGLLDCLYLN